MVVCIEGPAMIGLPGGQVTLSDRRTRRSWSVDVADFSIGVYPVTRTQYAAATDTVAAGGDQDRSPVQNVSWWDAVRYCNILSERRGLRPAYLIDVDAEHAGWDLSADGYRLPTEAEWEYACRAGTSGPRYGPIDDIAWYRGNSAGRSHAVGGKRPNPWGLFDMLGNVWDWCWDIYDAEVYGSYRVLRGGGWADEHWSCRASVRRRSHPTFAIDDVGFRVAGPAPVG
ncbi:formylglycine-generating enzyme family protein [Micromonospora sp. NBC_01813]|uniref:formylglycine-generating enzyme family protein n=1 Tax=Micromonospora sp. NBC_01813 TaxID=2975988 RepID=UPI002DD8195D|nr:SUMF1/EgtB/PvdO family nonheme iron enzyme [Micromonospora sp. NBC_01813]WSA10413.1 formylglycine-generating enzyme family protein [Micromonospora sp. NBC_01813]